MLVMPVMHCISIHFVLHIAKANAKCNHMNQPKKRRGRPKGPDTKAITIRLEPPSISELKQIAKRERLTMGFAVQMMVAKDGQNVQSNAQ